MVHSRHPEIIIDATVRRVELERDQ
jgi:hypothetical protein